MNLLEFIQEKTTNFLEWGEQQAGNSKAADRLRKAIEMYGHLYVLEQLCRQWAHLEREEAVARLKAESESEEAADYLGTTTTFVMEDDELARSSCRNNLFANYDF